MVVGEKGERKTKRLKNKKWSKVETPLSLSLSFSLSLSLSPG
jgi:hypothetical protein